MDDQAEGPAVEASLSHVLGITHRYAVALEAQVLERTALHVPDLGNPLPDEVRFGLLSRQTRFTVAVSRDAILWAEDLGRIFSRSIVETYLTMSWLIKNGQQADYESFVEYGLGQEKLLIEHLRARNRGRDGTADAAAVKERELWLSQFKYAYLTPVNVGRWSDKNVREMATEIDEKSLYDFVYVPFSSEVHGMWNAIAHANLRRCMEPLHRFHLIPDLQPRSLTIRVPLFVAEIMDRTYRAWEGSTALEPLARTAFDDLSDEMEKELPTVN
jgi:hypothetical protein